MPTGHRENLLRIFQSALSAVNGRTCVRAYLENKPPFGKIYMTAIGKAACAMAQGAQDVLGDRMVAALVVTKKDHAEPLPWPVLEAGHPVADESSLEAGRQLLAFIERIPEEAQVLVLLSGGASSLIEALPSGMDLDQFQRINRWLLASGLDINGCNRLRRRLSLIKGGRFAKLLLPHRDLPMPREAGSRERRPRRVLCLVISDVPGNDLRAVGSGPLVPDADLQSPPDVSGLPNLVTQALKHMPPAPAPDDKCFKNVKHEVIATLDDAKRAAADATAKFGYRAVVEPEFVGGDAVDAGARLAGRLLQSEPGVVHIWGGETTVRLPESPGRGGRNQSLALSAALAIQGHENTWFLAASTDGTDGPTEDAGALVDGRTVARGEEAGFSASQSLARADAGSFLGLCGDLVSTGPTGTNVMDIMLGLKLTESQN